MLKMPAFKMQNERALLMLFSVMSYRAALKSIERIGLSRLQLRRDPKITRLLFNFHGKQIGFTTDLAIFYVVLAASGRFVDPNLVPLAAARALEAGFHNSRPVAQ
jgi:hypothetical protein